jgi:hypothetical protein
VLGVAALLLAGAPGARAGISDISSVFSFKNASYEQTGDGNTLSTNGYFYSADLYSTVVGAYSAVTVTPGAGTPQSLSQVSPASTDYHYQTSFYPTQAAMDAAFPFGTYTFTTNTPDTASYNYTADDYPLSVPYLTGSDYANLQNMNPANAFTFDFSTDTPGSNATDSYVFFTIYDNTTSSYVVNDGFLSPSVTSVTVAANTLAPGNSYTYELDFSNRDSLTATPPAVTAFLGFDERTDGTFTTATPEPGFYGLMAIGLVGLFAVSRRRRQPAR